MKADDLNRVLTGQTTFVALPCRSGRAHFAPELWAEIRCAEGNLASGFGVRCESQTKSMSEPKRPGVDGDDETSIGVATKTRPKTKRPSQYRVLLLNDDYTPMEFVVAVLQKFFNKGREDAAQIMMHVHQHGVGECGVYTYEVAETKVDTVDTLARENGFPLKCIMERD